ncbi:MAG: hypothetical protein Q4C70_14725 [Planctomycetia bacterium]|nr:hypothetical protein [Planctomycetia bacterium]
MSQDVYLPGVTGNENENSDLLTTATGLSLVFWGQIVEFVGQFLGLLFVFLVGPNILLNVEKLAENSPEMQRFEEYFTLIPFIWVIMLVSVILFLVGLVFCLTVPPKHVPRGWLWVAISIITGIVAGVVNNKGYICVGLVLLCGFSWIYFLKILAKTLDFDPLKKLASQFFGHSIFATVFLLGLSFATVWLATAFYSGDSLLIAFMDVFIFHVITLALQLCHLMLLWKIVRYIRCGY